MLLIDHLATVQFLSLVASHHLIPPAPGRPTLPFSLSLSPSLCRCPSCRRIFCSTRIPSHSHAVRAMSTPATDTHTQRQTDSAHADSTVVHAASTSATSIPAAAPVRLWTSPPSWSELVTCSPAELADLICTHPDWLSAYIDLSTFIMPYADERATQPEIPESIITHVIRQGDVERLRVLATHPLFRINQANARYQTPMQVACQQAYTQEEGQRKPGSAHTQHPATSLLLLVSRLFCT